ncbi:hypothetical protein HMPREF1624_05392 [Sporothrix schenckii ATCC 58251]|uniref:Pentatricopeptide repeat domain-containing protein n=1 Tax=Sporothrix schenckii (strain ATCC 58251 / de Perez 2211183) TaxID=1391915 RepID=U7PVW2_SPOS1|nr:hypothetical protein HMPREF1624_05392 [Sporothrix schenckii ATCC 58251]
MSTRGPFVCRSCLVSRTAQRRPTLPPWATTTVTATATTPTSTPTTTVAVRTLSRHTAAVRGRLRRGDSRPSTASQRQTPLRATPVPRPSPKVEIPTLEDLQLASSNDPTHQYGRDEDVTVRFFDQQSDGTIRHVSNRSSIGDEAEAELAELEERLKETSTLMKDLEQRGGPTRRRTVRLRRKYDMIKEVEEEEALQTMADAAYEEADASETSGTSAVRIDDTGLSTNARRHVKNLNSVLRPAARRLENKNKTPSGGVDSKIITALWSRYGAARTGLAEAWSNVPPAVWSCLWEVLAWDDKKGSGVRNPRRMSHIYYLAKDMQAAGVPLTDEQQLLAMEAMFIEGWPAAALENWRRGAATLGARPATAAAYWELGVRMCSQQGDLDRAERAADRLFSDDLQDLLRQAASNGETIKRHGDPRVLFGLIRNAAAQGSKDKAWATYRRLRDLLDELEKQDGGMKIEDYDEVVSCFLTANHTEYAFDVFVDMMFSGALDLHQQQLQQQRTRPKKLPSAVANHFFFGKWLKRLIGAGDLDGAYRVLHFMQARGIMTASVQVNGLLGAWLRSGSAANQERADVLAWRMVESRCLFVDLRRREQQMDWPLKLRVGGFTKDEVAAAAAAATTDGADLTFVPRATLETFALMADNYKNRGQLAQLERLWEAFRACEMASTDAFMMNQLLESYVHEGRSDEARALYRDLVLGPQRIEPNAHTFLVLFKSLAVHRTVFRMMSDDDRRAAGADCRQLAADMVKLAPVAFKTETSAYASEIGKGSAQDTRSMAFYQALGRIVLHSFRKTGDYVGLCVMLRVLRPLFHSAAAGGGAHKDTAGDGFDRFLMTDSLAVELVAETSALERDTPTARHRIFKASEAVEVLLLEARQRQLRVYGWNEGEKETSLHAGTDADLSDDLATVVAHVYRVKAATVSDKEFAAMYEMAVDELGVRKYL